MGEVTTSRVVQDLKRMGPVMALECFTRAGLLGSVMSGMELTMEQRVRLLNVLLPRTWIQSHESAGKLAEMLWVTPERHMRLRAWLDERNLQLHMKVEKNAEG